MGESNKLGGASQIREWIKLLIPIVVVVLGWYLSRFVVEEVDEDASERLVHTQTIEQQRRNDIAVAQMAVDVLKMDNPNLHDWLPQLVATIKDTSLRKVISEGISLNQRVSRQVRDSVEKIEKISPEGRLLLDSLTLDLQIKTQEAPRFRRTVVVPDS